MCNNSPQWKKKNEIKKCKKILKILIIYFPRYSGVYFIYKIRPCSKRQNQKLRKHFWKIN